MTLWNRFLTSVFGPEHRVYSLSAQFITCRFTLSKNHRICTQDTDKTSYFQHGPNFAKFMAAILEMTSYRNSSYENISFFVKIITTHPENSQKQTWVMFVQLECIQTWCETGRKAICLIANGIMAKLFNLEHMLHFNSCCALIEVQNGWSVHFSI